jgi:uracil-DNA glycosylase
MSLIATLDKQTYAGEKSWKEFYDEGGDLADMKYHLSWYVLFMKLLNDPRFEKLNEKIKTIVEQNKNMMIWPLPQHVSSAFLITKASDLKVVFIGQDPYFNHESYSGKSVGQAMGLSFSVPHDVAIPSSLGNIYSNMVKYGHIKRKPESGNLWYWASQGCLMLNAALTVEDGSKEAHLKTWEWFTDYVIRYISENMDDIIFVLWGGYAYKKASLIDKDRHHLIVSSHPSGLSANKPFQQYPAFMNEDHFGKINEILERTGRQQIMWD